jgi:protein O-GlcNAc transferase
MDKVLTDIDAALDFLRHGAPDEALARLHALPQSTGDATLSAAFGMVHLAAEQYEDALVALRRAVSLGDTTPATLLNLALSEDHAGDPTRARQLIRAVADNCPQWDEPLLREAEILRRAGDILAAISTYDAALDRNPRRPESLIALAVLLLGRGEAERAQMLMLRCSSVTPHNVQVWDTLGIALMMTGDAAAAETAFGRAQHLAPTNPAIALRLVDATLAANTAPGELARLETACAATPRNAVLLLARGVLLDRLGRRDDAIDILDAAVTLSPDMPEIASAFAESLVRANRITQAIPALARALVLSPDDLGLRNNHAAALVRVQRHQQGREELEALIAEHGEQPGFVCNLTNALVSLGLQPEGIALARRALATAPDSSIAWRGLGNALPYCHDVDAANLLQVNRRIAATLPPQAKAPLNNNADPTRRLRIGLLSPSLKTHPVGWLTIAAFETLDPSAFEIVCLGPDHPGDAIARRFRAAASQWIVLDRYADASMADRIRELEIDLLIDLSGYGDQGLMTLCAARVAPVQVKWVGSQSHSTGLPEMDWFITDKIETPTYLAPFYSERLLTLPDGYVCYSPPAYAPDVGPLPAAKNDFITFGCFNNLAKVTEQVIAAWSQVLLRVSNARFILKCHQMAEPKTRDRIAALFASHGVAPDRVTFRANVPHRTLLSEYNDIDIVLDPFPYSGGLTTCEALWMGVPTVTLAGDIFAARHAASHLTNAGLPDWVADNLPSYLDLAVRHASNIPALGRLRAGLREQVRRSPLCDAPRFGKNLGTALRHAWTEWCATQ